MTIKCETYKFKDFKDILQINRSQWIRHQKEIIEWYSQFFNIEFIGNKRISKVKVTALADDSSFEIESSATEVEFEPYPNSRNKQEVEKYYRDTVSIILEEYPRNTGSNLGRIIAEEYGKYPHKPVTAAKYVRPILKSDYEPVDAAWCSYNAETFEYREMPEPHIKALHELINKYRNVTADDIEDTVDNVLRYNTGRIPLKQLAKEMVSKVNSIITAALEEFNRIYHYRPVRVFYYIKKPAILEGDE